MKIDVSFKKTTREIRLYLYVKSLEEKSDFVKDALEFYINYLESNKNQGEIKC